MISYVLGKSVALKMFFTYINHEKRSLSKKKKKKVPHSQHLADFVLLPP